MRYYRHRSNETLGGKYDHWGLCTALYEIGDNGYPTRQLESYDIGIALKYDQTHPKDKYGWLEDVALDHDKLLDLGAEEISAEWFEKCWISFKVLNRDND